MAERLVVGAWENKDTGWTRVSVIDTWRDLQVEPRFNQPGPWSMTIPVGAQVFQMSKRHLITVDFRGTRFTGAVENFDLTSDDETGAPLLVTSGTDTMSWLGDALGWPTPSLALKDQNSVRWYATGPAESVLRNLIQANLVDRLGYQIDVPPTEGRGPDVIVDSTFTNVLEIVQDKLTDSGLGIRLGLVNGETSTTATMALEFYTPADRSARVRLAQRVGVMATWRQSDQIPSATRVIVQAAKEQTGHEVASVNVAANSITNKSDKDNKLRTGDIITFTGSGTPPAPLELDVAYHAIRVDKNTFKVAETRRLASQGTAIDLTDNGDTVKKITVTEETRRYRMLTSADEEAEWGRIRESITDSSGDDDNSSLDQTALESLGGSAPQRGFEISTTEPEAMQYGVHYGIGDQITVEPLLGESTVEHLGGARINGSSDAGVTVTLLPGNPDATNPLFSFATVVRSLQRKASQVQED